ncbi:MAG: hypothetical protein LUE13_06610 [Akkermansiaceae bacterium]|nr:hypothetical protein [Akkermansiaceae bacterium]
MHSLISIRPVILLGCACLLASCGGGSGKSDSSAVAPPQTLEAGSTIVMTDGHGVSYKITSSSTLETGDGIFSGIYTYAPGAASARFSMTLAEKDREHPRTIKSFGEMTFTSATEGTYRVTDYDSSATSPAGLGGPFRITR